MKSDHCEYLDAYLSGDLPADAESRFTAHLDHCEGCRDNIDQQRWIDTLLCSSLGAELESPPAALLERVHQRTLHRRHRSVRLTLCGLAAAALAIAAGWTAILDRQGIGPAIVPVNEAALAQTRNSPSPEHPRSTFVGGPNVLVVPMESSHPNVTVVRVYPIFQPTIAAQASMDSPAATDDSLWPVDLNGG